VVKIVIKLKINLINFIINKISLVYKSLTPTALTFITLKTVVYKRIRLDLALTIIIPDDQVLWFKG